MLAIKLRTNLDQFRRGLSDAHRKQVPFAVAGALNAIATGAQADIQASMKKTFDRPTPWTLRATYVKKASKTQLTAWVGIREFAPKGTPAWKYLGPQVDGGPRRQKAFERRLQLTNRAAAFAIPAPGAELDAFGNMSRGQIVKILAGVGALQDVAPAGKGKRRRGPRPSFEIRRGKNGKARAVYEVPSGGGKGKPVLWLTDRAPTYNARWDVKGVVLASIAHHRKDAFARAWSHALATAKP